MVKLRNVALLSGMTVEDVDALEHTVMVSRRPRWVLEISTGDPVELTGSFVKIGRRPSTGAADMDSQLVQVHDATRTVSRNHARLMQIEGEWLIEDLRSANGTVLGPVHDATAIDEGFHPIPDGEFWLGDIHFAIRDMTTNGDIVEAEHQETGEATGDSDSEVASDIDVAGDMSDTSGEMDSDMRHVAAPEAEATGASDTSGTAEMSGGRDISAELSVATGNDNGDVAMEPEATPVYVATGDMTVCGFCGQWNPATMNLCRECGVTLVAPQRRDTITETPQTHVPVYGGSAPATPPATPWSDAMQKVVQETDATRQRQRRRLVWGLIGGSVAAIILSVGVAVTIVLLI